MLRTDILDPEKKKKTCLSPAVASRGMDLVALAVKVACQTTVTSLCEAEPTDKGCPSWWQQIVELGSTPKGEVLYTACIGSFVREGMKVLRSLASPSPALDRSFACCLTSTHSSSLLSKPMNFWRILLVSIMQGCTGVPCHSAIECSYTISAPPPLVIQI